MHPRRYKRLGRLKTKHSLIKKILKSRLVWEGAAVIFLSSAAVYGVFFSSFFQITHIEIEGTQSIKEEVLGVLQGHLSNVLLLDKNAIRKEILASFPVVESLSIHKEFPNGLRIVLQEREEVGVWCQTSKEVEELSQECFALDKYGVIFEQTNPEGSLLIESKGREASLQERPPSLGERVMDVEVLENILTFQKALDDFPLGLHQEEGLHISSFSLVSKEKVRVRISEGWEMYVDPSGDIDWQIAKAKLVLEKEISPERRPLLEYMDLRFGNQAYVKYRE